MGKLKINELDFSDDRKTKCYENLLYQSFKDYPESFFEGIWFFNHDEFTAKMRIPYSSQKILLAEAENEIVGAVVINTNMQLQLQLEMVGFNIEKIDGKTAEVLAIFSKKIMVGRDVVLARLGESCVNILKKIGIKTCWATCTEKHLRGYISIGFLNKGKINFHGDDEYLIYLNI